MGNYLVPGGEIDAEIVILNSRFIAFAAPASRPDEAKKYLEDLRKRFSDASHHVCAYRIGYGNSEITHSSDDGEPSGTAGRPVLTVLQNSEFGDTVLVVVRYFGGTKLGTGGLVKAYTEAAQTVLKILPKARKVATYTIKIVIAYKNYDRFQSIIQKFHATVLKEYFDVQIGIEVLIEKDEFESFKLAMNEMTASTADIEILDMNDNTILPI